MLKLWSAIGLFLSFEAMNQDVVLADQYHYNNIIVGDRAMGLGGAYTAISDDASGVVYNPAGLGFALSNDISGSANAFYRKRVEYKKIIGDNSYVETSTGLFNPFFGGLQKLDNISNGLVFAFGLYSSDAELKDQDDLISAPELGIVRFHRSANIRASTNYFGVALGKRFGKGFSGGIGLNALWVNELTQIYQDSVQGPIVQNGVTYYSLLTRADRQELDVQGFEPVLGLQWAPTDKLSIGLSFKKALLIKDTLKISQEQTSVAVDDPNTGITALNDISRVPVTSEIEDAIKTWPSETRLGFAYFASSRMMFSFDAVHRSATDGEFKLLDRNSVVNYALGSEIYVTTSVPIRLGFFTNNDARPEIDRSRGSQDDHLDYKGASVFVGWVQPNSQISVGTILQQGKGEAQKISGSTNVQDVVALSTTFGISATHNF